MRQTHTIYGVLTPDRDLALHAHSSGEIVPLTFPTYALAYSWAWRAFPEEDPETNVVPIMMTWEIPKTPRKVVHYPKKNLKRS